MTATEVLYQTSLMLVLRL